MSAVESDYQYLKEHDSQWLEDTLHRRAEALRASPPAVSEAVKPSHLEQIHANAVTGPRLDSSSCGPFDITQDVLPLDLHVSDHVKFIRDYDWASTPLGPMASWSTSLRCFVNMINADNRAACLWWGPERIAIYNLTYVHIAAHRHPQSMGSPVTKVWPELTEATFGKSFDHADRTGQPTSGDHAQFFIKTSDDRMEELWASWAMLPLPGPGGNLGYYNSATEVTQEVLNNRRMETLQSLDQFASEAGTVDDYWGQILQALEDNPFEAPFVALYGPVSITKTARAAQYLGQADSDEGLDSVSSVSQGGQSVFAGTEWSLEGVLGGSAPGILPATVDLDSGSGHLTPLFHNAMSTKTVQILRYKDMAPALQRAAKSRIWDGEACHTVVLLPIWSSYQEHRSGFLLLGLNPRRPYDDHYSRFVRLFHHQLTTGLSTLVTAEDEARRGRAAARIAAKDRIRLVEKLAASEHEAQLSELRFRSMADLAPIGIFEFSPEGRLLYANSHWIELTGYEPEVVKEGMSLANALAQVDRAAFEEQWAQLFSGQDVNFECRLDRPYSTQETYAGERLEGETWVLITAYALHDDTMDSRTDCITGIFGCLVDISRQKWMEGFQERRFKEQTERRRQQETFMDTTSHEARNPLAAITLCADDLSSNVREILSGDGDDLVFPRKSATALLESIDIIVSCARHQKRIIDDVLTFSKLDSGMLKTCPVPMLPTEVVDQALKMFQNELHRSNVELEYKVGMSYTQMAVGWVLLDPTRFLQILVNLLNNAVKFTKHEESRQITVTLEACHARPTSEQCGVVFAPLPSRRSSIHSSLQMDDGADTVFIYVSIKDTGPGIMQHELDNLFQRFQQASPKTYAQYGGSGLGLWISKELCAKLGGQIGVASSVSNEKSTHGSTFAFYVQAPRCASPTAAQEQSEIERNVATALQASVKAVRVGTSPPSEQPNGAAGEPAIKPSAAKQDVTKSAELRPAVVRLLVVEDNLVNQKVMRKQLLRAGFEVAVANHGKEALDSIYPTTSEGSTGVAPPFDVVLMDVEMPVMGGLEATRIIRAREQESSYPYRSRLPILGVTANARAEQQAACLDAGMNSVVTKPFHMSDLLPAIEKLRVSAEASS